MMRNRKAKLLAVGAAALLGTVAATGTAQARDVTASYYKSNGDVAGYATSYGANGAVKVCDTLNDNVGVTVQYLRVDTNGTPGKVYDSSGPGSCKSSTDIQSNPVAAFSVCLGNATTDCSLWAYTWRS